MSTTTKENNYVNDSLFQFAKITGSTRQFQLTLIHILFCYLSISSRCLKLCQSTKKTFGSFMLLSLC